MTLNLHPTAEVLTLLNTGTIEMEGYVPWGSNRTFLVTVCPNDADEGEAIQAIYKPQRGERPLWDFPTGSLCLRERAAYVVSEAIGWHLVPPTILRDGPHGRGSLQYFIEHDPEEHFFTFQNDHPDQLRQVALFDILINNADRKSGHVIRDEHGRVWGIDHGISFHQEYKLRSVIWDYAGSPIPSTLLTDLQQFAPSLTTTDHPDTQELPHLLSLSEITAMRHRLQMLLDTKQFIAPGPSRHYPWPLV